MTMRCPMPAEWLRLVTFLIALAASASVQAQDAPEKKPKVDRVITQLVEAHNKERSKEDLPPLTLEDHLVEAAKVHARDMAEHDVMTHDGTDGSNSGQRVTRAGYHFLNTGENVAFGYRTVPEVMKVWMESPPHKKNILAEYSEIGVAVAYSEDGKPYWCAEFGKPRPKTAPDKAEVGLVEKINAERTTAKARTLSVDPRLARAAKEQAAKLAKAKSTGGGTASFDFIDKKQFLDLAVSTASGHNDAEAMIGALKENPDLKAQILGKYSRIGTGYATAEDGTPYWCLILANPKK